MILIDDREKETTYKYISQIVGEENCKIERLEIGDVVCPEKRVCVERKSIQDFYASVVSQHVFSQCKQMQANYDTSFVIIAGTYRQLLADPNLFSVNVNVLLGAMASIVSKYKIPVIVTENEKQLCYLVVKIIEKYGESPDLTPIRRLSFNTEDMKVSSLTAIRGVSIEKAKLLMEHFGSIKAICDSQEEKLQEVAGIGPKIAAAVKEVFY